MSVPSSISQLKPAEIQNLHELATSWAGLNGLFFMRASGIQPAPFSLLPMPFPRRVYNQVKEVMPDFNELVHRVSLDYDFLMEHLSPVAAADEFQDRLLKLLKSVKEEGIRQKICMGVHRSDYMLHAAPGAPLVPKQVEINTISSGFIGFSGQVSRLHSYLLSRCEVPGMSAADCPENSPVEGIADGLAEASALYAAAEPPLPSAGAGARRRLAVLFVVQPAEGNIFDQRMLELRLWERHAVPVVRATLAQVEAEGALDEGSRRLVVGGHEISVVYFRAGYTPDDYKGEAEWAARLRLERSAAVKCPSVAYQCAGAKKIQQVLAQEGVLERFASSPAAAARMRATFAGLYPLGDGSPAADAALAAARADPTAYVLKPQREGGGNNLYDAELAAAAAGWPAERLRAHILMELIRAPRAPAVFVRAAGAGATEATATEATTELGTFSVVLADASGGGGGGGLLASRVVGHLLRSKGAAAKETGVAAGFGVLDSPLLYDD